MNALRALQRTRPSEASAVAREELFAGLFTETAPRLIRYLQFRFGSQADAEDIAADAFARAWRKINDFSDRERCAAWLFRTARNVAIDRLRRSNRTVSLDTMGVGDAFEEGDIAIDVARQEEVRLLRRLIAELPERQRDVLELRLVAGLSHRDIAHIVGTSEGNAAKLLHRAIAQLRQQMKQGGTS